MSRILYTFLLLFSLLLMSCDSKTPDQKRVPILEVEGRFLYLDQIEEIMPPNVRENDSIQIADRFIRKWVTDVLLYETAKRNIPDKAEIDRLLEDYRKNLIIHQFQQRLMQQRLPKSPAEDAIRDFYERFPEQFQAQEPYLKGILLIVPVDAPRLNNVRSWVQSGNTNALEQIEKYSMQNALSYDYFGDRWIPLSEILRKLPSQRSNLQAYFSSIRFHEESDSLKHYFLGIESIVKVGETEPFELAKDKISNIIMNKMKSDYISDFQNEMYRDAVKDGTITFFKN